MEAFRDTFSLSTPTNDEIIYERINFEVKHATLPS